MTINLTQHAPTYKQYELKPNLTPTKKDPFARILFATCFTKLPKGDKRYVKFFGAERLEPLTPSRFTPVYELMQNSSSPLGGGLRPDCGASSSPVGFTDKPFLDSFHRGSPSPFAPVEAGCPLEEAFFDHHFGPSLIAKPTDAGLMLLCAHYFRKYGVDITVTSSYETFEEALKAPLFSPRAKAWGIIATNGDPDRSHVTPVICYKEKDQNQILILQLDSIQTPVLAVREILGGIRKAGMEAEEETPLPYLVCDVKGERQLDGFGCRTDALVVLKDALRILNDESFTDLPKYLNLTEEYGFRFTFFLPAAWAKTAQVFPSVKESDDTRILSKSRTLKTFRDRFVKAPAPDSIQLFLPFNSYLNEKGKTLVCKIDSLSALKDSELRRRFRLLEAFYMGPQPTEER